MNIQRNILIFVFCALCILYCRAQSNVSNVISIIVEEEKKPSVTTSSSVPILQLVNSAKFEDENQRIDANEQCNISFKIKNVGNGDAKNCEARVRLIGTTSGITARAIKLPIIPSGKTYEVRIPIYSGSNLQTGKVTFSIEVYEPNGWGVSPFDVSVTTKAYDPPLLQVVDYNITSKSGKIGKVDPFSLTFILQNTQYGDAEDVKVKIKLPENVAFLGDSVFAYPLIKSGEGKTIKIIMAANLNYSSINLPITIDIHEKYGKYAENKTVSVALNQTVSSSINIAAKIEPPTNRNPIELAMMTSDVDRDIPISPTQNNNTLVLIVANENYKEMPKVPYAVNDGNTFKEYCIKTLGISQEQIMFQPNTTLNDLRRKIDLLKQKVHARYNAGKETYVLFYYTGHGMPDVNTQSAYLMPVDGFDDDITTGYKLDDIYQQLGQLQANMVTVFLDACFSGMNRNNEALSVHKGARLTTKSGVPTGNVVVFAASQGNQTASVNDKEKHGLFTYYLLKKLKETEGDVSLYELTNYVMNEVNLKSLEIHEKAQNPNVIVSPQIENQWQNWKLK